MGIARQLGMIFQYRALAVRPLQKQFGETAAPFARNFEDGDELSRTRRAFDLEFVAIIIMETLERFDDEIVERHPHRTAPVGVAAKQPAARLGGAIGHFVNLSVRPEMERLG